MSIKSIYLAGPMTGKPGFGFDLFHDAAEQLRANGYRVFNPAESKLSPHATDRSVFMKIDLRWIIDNADAVFVLACWENSPGALTEVRVAQECGVPVYDYASWLIDGDWEEVCKISIVTELSPWDGRPLRAGTINPDVPEPWRTTPIGDILKIADLARQSAVPLGSQLRYGVPTPVNVSLKAGQLYACHLPPGGTFTAITDQDGRFNITLPPVEVPKTAPPESILDEAKRIVHKARNYDYGSPYDNHSLTAEYWTTLFDTDVTPEQVCLANILQKIARESHSHTRDNIVDIAGYAENYMMVKDFSERLDDDLELGTPLSSEDEQAS